MTDHEKASVLSWRGSDKYYNPYIGRGGVLFTGEMFVSPCLIRPKSFATENSSFAAIFALKECPVV